MQLSINKVRNITTITEKVIMYGEKNNLTTLSFVTVKLMYLFDRKHGLL